MSSSSSCPSFLNKVKENIPSEKPSSDQPIQKVDLQFPMSNRVVPAFLLKNVLSPQECKFIIDNSETNGFQKAEDFCWMYRNRLNDRIESFDYDLADVLLTRCKPFIPQLDSSQLKETAGFSIHSFNPKWRMCRYTKGHHFGGHCDGPFHEGKDKRSFLTFMIYLNSEDKDFTGGSTNFIDYHSKKLVHRVKPEAGTAIIFFQEDVSTYHEGAELTGGTKYILRTDIMFKRNSNVQKKN